MYTHNIKQRQFSQPTTKPASPGLLSSLSLGMHKAWGCSLFPFQLPWKAPATSFLHRWVNNSSFPPSPLVLGWGSLTALASAPHAGTGLWENICAASESPGCWRGGSFHHTREDRGSGNGQHWAQNLPVRLCYKVGTSAFLMLWPLEGHMVTVSHGL